MADIAHVASAALAYASRTTITIGKPTGTVENHVMVGSINHETAITSVPSGWSLIVTAQNGGNLNCSLYRKRATASEGSDYSWGQSGGGYAGGGISTYANVITSGEPVEASVGRDGGASTSTGQWDSITTTSANAMLVGGIATFNVVTCTAASATSPLTNRERVDVDGTAMYDGLQASAGASGNKTVPFSASTTYASCFCALTPAPSGGLTATPSDSTTTTDAITGVTGAYSPATRFEAVTATDVVTAVSGAYALDLISDTVTLAEAIETRVGLQADLLTETVTATDAVLDVRGAYAPATVADLVTLAELVTVSGAYAPALIADAVTAFDVITGASTQDAVAMLPPILVFVDEQQLDG